MENELINGYILLTDKIAENYGIGNQLMLHTPVNRTNLSKSFNKELTTHALLWLSTMFNRSPDVMQSLVEQVNYINRRQKERFTLRCQVNSTIIPPFNTIGLN